MNFFGALAGGLIGGVVGGAIWAGIAYFTGYEIGWIAWGIGALVGYGTYRGAEAADVRGGVMAVVISLLAIAGGKYAAVELAVSKAFSGGEVAALYDNDEYVVSYLADEELEAMIRRGETPDFPAEADFEMPDSRDDYPFEVWNRAQSRWDQMSADDQQTFRDDKRRQHQAMLATLRSGITEEGFLNSFGAMDFLFGALAIFTAFKVGSGVTSD
ncbi:MAG: hypothetical protein AAFX76_09030 [Planctomycetota bacterium]